jgi:hypothetical protein
LKISETIPAGLETADALMLGVTGNGGWVTASSTDGGVTVTTSSPSPPRVGGIERIRRR